jgi:8-oxo-dGTP diphosphatase
MSCFNADITLPAPALKLVLAVGVVLVDVDGRVLVAERPEGKLYAGAWEFPGGKPEAGETPEWALVRELREELGIETKPTCFSPLTFLSHTYPEFHVLVPLFLCRVWQGVVQGREGQNVKWVRPEQLYEINLLAGDLPAVPIIQQLI